MSEELKPCIEDRTYKPGQVCYRCGIERIDQPYGPCVSWGKSWKRHLWNDEELIVEVHYIQPDLPTPPASEGPDHIVDANKMVPDAGVDVEALVDGCIAIAEGHQQENHRRVRFGRLLTNALAQRDNPDLDGTDAAHPAWWRGHDQACKSLVQRMTKCLDGEDDGSGVMHADVEPLRRRLIGLASRDARHADEVNTICRKYIKRMASLDQTRLEKLVVALADAERWKAEAERRAQRIADLEAGLREAMEWIAQVQPAYIPARDKAYADAVDILTRLDALLEKEGE